MPSPASKHGGARRRHLSSGRPGPTNHPEQGVPMSRTTQPNALDAIAGLDLESFKYSIPGIEFRMGAMPGFVTALPIRTMVEMVHDEVITRRDYEIEGIEPGQRAMSEE